MGTQQSLQKKNPLISSKLKEKIKKKYNQECLNGTNYTYALLKKKCQSGGLSPHQRLFYLQGTKQICYARTLPKEVMLPFDDENLIPKAKTHISLDLIENVIVDDDSLIINFKPERKEPKWVLICFAKNVAEELKKIIDDAFHERQAQLNNRPIAVIIPPLENGNQQSNNNGTNNFISNQPAVNQPQQLATESNEGKIQKKFSLEQQVVAIRQEERTSGIKSVSIQPTKPSVSKPISTFFVGSTAVQNQKMQSEIKNQRRQLQAVSSRIKQQYQAKKKEEEQKQEEFTQEMLKGVLNTMTDVKFQIEKLKSQWSYEFAKGQDQFEIVARFKAYIEIVSQKIINELGLQEHKRYYKPTEETSKSIRYDVEGVTFELFINELSEVSSFQDRGTVISSSKIKEAQQEMKNYNYILQLTRNKGRIRVPLMMIIQYKGFTGVAKAVIPQAESYGNIESLQRDLDVLQNESRIDNSVFQDTDNGRIVPVQTKLYEKLSRSENIPRKYDICYLQDLKNYLPQDFYQFSKEKPYERLREQFVKDEEYEETMFCGENMVNIVNRIKLPPNLKDAINNLTDVAKSIPERVNELVMQLENLQQVVTNSQELSELMHLYGLNIRYLGLLLERSKQSWLKAIIASEIAARCSKYFLKFDLQDSTLNLYGVSVESVYEFQKKQVITFLNKLLGNSNETDLFWKQLNKQAQTYFRCSVNRQYLNLGYFMQSIQKNGRLLLKNLPAQNLYFKSSALLTLDNFTGFVTHCKVYNLDFTQLYSIINARLQQLTHDSYDQLRALLNLTRKQHIPNHFKFNRLYDRILLFVLNWLPPSEGKGLYYSEDIELGEIMPSKTLYEIKLTEIKWYLKHKKEKESEQIRDQIVDHINRWIGSSHPILTELYDIFSNYYLRFKDEEKKTVNYCKSAIKNQEKLIGVNHIKLADSYYLLGNAYLTYARKVEALNSFKKAKEILYNNEAVESQAYGEICLKMGQLYLGENSVEEAYDAGLQAFGCLEHHEKQQLFVESVELISRTFEVSEKWEDYLQFTEQRLVSKLNPFLTQPLLLDRMVKVVIFPILHEIAAKSRDICGRILHIMNELPQSSKVPNAAYAFIKNKIGEGTFPGLFFGYLTDIEAVLSEIEDNGIVNRWKGFQYMSNKNLQTKIGPTKTRGFDFISTIQALNTFLSGNYISCIFFEQEI